MKRWPSRCIALLLTLGALRAFPAPDPLGAGMEGFPYPYAVSYLDLRMEGEPARLAYMDIGPAGAPNGRAVVLLHGRNFFGAYWEQTIRVLSQAGYRVVVPDQIGFGKSSKPDVPHSLHVHARNIHQLLETLGVRKVSLVAHSLGGMMAVRFALMYPQMVDRMFLEDPVGLEDYRVKVPYATREELTADALQQTRDGIDRLVRGFFVQWKPEYQVYADVQYRWLLGPEAYRIARTAAHTFLMAYEQPVLYELPLVPQPTLLVVGEQDRTAIGRNRVGPEVRATLGLYPELARTTAQAIPDCTLILLPGVGHIPHLEVPDRFHDELLRFLAG